jgi:hypothetical protein
LCCLWVAQWTSRRTQSQRGGFRLTSDGDTFQSDNRLTSKVEPFNTSLVDSVKSCLPSRLSISSVRADIRREQERETEQRLTA